MTLQTDLGHPATCFAGAIPFLPNNDILVSRLEKQWGDLSSYQGIRQAYLLLVCRTVLQPWQVAPRGDSTGADVNRTACPPVPCCSTSAKGNSVVTGIQLGNVWIGVQVRPAAQVPAAGRGFPLMTLCPLMSSPLN